MTTWIWKTCKPKNHELWAGKNSVCCIQAQKLFQNRCPFGSDIANMSWFLFCFSSLQICMLWGIVMQTFINFALLYSEWCFCWLLQNILELRQCAKNILWAASILLTNLTTKIVTLLNCLDCLWYFNEDPTIPRYIFIRCLQIIAFANC